MVPGKKKGSEASGMRRGTAGQRPTIIPAALQPRAAAAQRFVKPPSPAHAAQSSPRDSRPAAQGARQQPNRTAHAPKPTAPYRPQPTPQCLQRKTPVGRAGSVIEAPRAAAARPATPKQPQRPSPAGLATTKAGVKLPTAVPPRTAAGVLQRKESGVATRPAPAAVPGPHLPPAGRNLHAPQTARPNALPAAGVPRARIPSPAFAQGRTIQRMEEQPPPPQFNYQQSKQDINLFVLKSEESNTNDNSQTRSFSQSNRYEFRHNTGVHMPDSGIDPVDKPKKKKKKDPEGYYYHVTSYYNLLNICKVGLNPAFGGKLGGSCNQNESEEMNASSAKESQNKTYVATVTKLTQRYLSLRLRQEDLFNKHREFIVYVLNTYFNFRKSAVNMVLDRFLLGEQPAVLRFKDYWDNRPWEHDPIEKQAFALVGELVSPDRIECLTLEGWVPLTSIPIDDITAICGRNAKEVMLRTALLTFFRKYNPDMSNASPQELMGRLAEKLAKYLKKAGITVAQSNNNK